MSIEIKNKYIVISAVIAFIAYQFVNFVYFPLHTVFPDEQRFIGRAILFSQTGVFGTGDGTAWEMPLASLFFAFFYKLTGNEENLIISIRIIQSFLLIFQGILLYKISLKIFNDNLTAFLTFIAVLLYPYFIYYQGLLLSETLFNTLLVTSFYFIYCWYEMSFKINRYFILSILFLVLSIYMKATLSLLAPLLLAGFYFFNKYDLKNTLKILLYSFILYSLFLSPWWIRNYNIFNTFVPFTTTSAWNLYLGNNPNNLNGGCDWSIDVNPAVVQRISKIDSEVDKNIAYSNEAIKFIKENPKRFFELAVLKLKRFYSIVPNADGFNSGYYKWISIGSYGLIFILFLISIFYNKKRFKHLSAIYLLFIYFTLIHMVTIASLRYRLPLEPFMILLSIPVFVDMLKYKWLKKTLNYKNK